MSKQAIHYSNLKARDAALAIYQQQSVTPTSLVKYQSRGKLLIIGDKRALEFAEMVNLNGKHKLFPTILLLGAESLSYTAKQSTLNESNVIVVADRKIHIHGYLGHFSVSLLDPNQVLNGVEINCDLILDLSPQAILDIDIPPNGYFYSNTNDLHIQQLIEQLTNMTGSFEKPVYIDYNPEICAHSRSGKVACSKCIDACPAQAISSIAEMVKVDTHLCQGGGVCATLCPSGAMRYVYPQTEDLLKNLRLLIRHYTEQGGIQPIIAFFADADGGEIAIPEQANILPVMVEELASVGLDIWLSLLAYGAQAVLMVNRGHTAESLLVEIAHHVEISQEILSALGYSSQVLALVSETDLLESIDTFMPIIEQASFAAIGGKRQTAFFAIDHLYEQAEKPKKMAVFSAPTLFGTAYVEDNCTLCHACVAACPGKALQSGQGVPQLKFIEANCVQCGMCTRTCPENAISISPRLLFEREQRQQQRLLFEESPFNCISCGKPFATRSVIENMLAKLGNHWMFKTERAKNRLKMCDDCRVVDVVQDEAAMNGNQEQSLH